MKFFEKIFGKFKTYEICFLTVSLATTLVLSIVFKCYWLAILSSLFGLTKVCMTSKGSIIAQIFGLIYCGLYTGLAYLQGYYGEMIIQLGVNLPLLIYGTISWFKNKNNSVVKISKTNKYELGIVICLIPLLFISSFFLFDFLNTENVIISALSASFVSIAYYLTSRRSSISFIFYIICDVIYIVLWGLPTFTQSINTLPVFVSCIFFFFSDVYGIINWTRLRKKQKENTNFNQE